MPSGAGQPPASATSVPLRSTSTSSTTETTTSGAEDGDADDPLGGPRPADEDRQGRAEQRQHDRERDEPASRRVLACDHLLLVGHLVVHDVGAGDGAVADVVLHLVVAG